MADVVECWTPEMRSCGQLLKLKRKKKEKKRERKEEKEASLRWEGHEPIRGEL